MNTIQIHNHLNVIKYSNQFEFNKSNLCFTEKLDTECFICISLSNKLQSLTYERIVQHDEVVI